MNSSALNTFAVVPRDELSAAQTREMFELLAQYFDGVTQSQFERDLAEKNRVILLKRGSRLVGFSTMLAYTTSFEDGSVNVIYSGDTIVAREAWGTTALPRAWVAAVEELRSKMPGKCYWLLLTSGFRTYRFLPVFWREFFPRFDRTTPPDQQRLLDQLALKRFGAQYDLQSGVVRFTQPQRLRNELNQIAAERARDAHVAFFARRNPNHANGDELVCLTELGPENLTAAGRRIMTSHESFRDNC